MNCPVCAGYGVEVTSNGDAERRYLCVNGCGYQWGVPFEGHGAPKPVDKWEDT